MKKFVLAAVLALSTTSLISAATIPVGGGWQSFSFGLAGDIINFDYTSVGPVTIRLVDCCVIGDEFLLSLDGGAGIPTSATALLDDGVQSGATDGDTAWADGRLSSLLMGGPAGFHTLDVEVTRNALDTTNGGGFIRVDAVPEPSTFVLFGGAAIGLALLRRRKMQHQK